ncbi:hypothetical protein ABZ746_11275 [Streptomyces sp. NPDC020096]
MVETAPVGDQAGVDHKGDQPDGTRGERAPARGGQRGRGDEQPIPQHIAGNQQVNGDDQRNQRQRQQAYHFRADGAGADPPCQFGQLLENTPLWLGHRITLHPSCLIPLLPAEEELAPHAPCRRLLSAMC